MPPASARRRAGRSARSAARTSGSWAASDSAARSVSRVPQAREILDRSLVHLFLVMYVDDGGQIPRQRLPNGPIDALEEVHFDVVWSRGAGMRRPADRNAHRIEPGLLYQAKCGPSKALSRLMPRPRRRL